jgi:hypothetical protein
MLIIRGSKDSGAMAVTEKGEGSIRRRRRASGVRSEQTVSGGVVEWWCELRAADRRNVAESG